MEEAAEKNAQTAMEIEEVCDCACTPCLMSEIPCHVGLHASGLSLMPMASLYLPASS